MEPIGIVAAVTLSILLSVACITFAIECKKRKIKPSRSDNDLSSLNDSQEV